jgi:hypothetical protein
MDRATHLYQRERELVGDALMALTRTTGLEAKIVATEPKAGHGANLHPDAVIDIQGAGRRHRYLVEAKRVDRTVTLATVKHQLERYGKPGVLIAPYLTAELANHCRDKLDLQFMDTAGNAYLRGPGLYVFIKGEKPQGVAANGIGARGGGTATALRVVFALLCKPQLLNAPYREIVDAAGVALGAVGWVFFDLQARGLVGGGQRKRNRRFLEPKRLLDEWVTNYAIKLRPKLNPRRFRAPDANWWRKVHLAEGHAWWGGEVAADHLTHYLKPAACTIYLDRRNQRETLGALVAKNKLQADLEGDVEFLDRFWNFTVPDNRPNIVPPLLVYADLLATLDPRNLEVAKMIRERYLDHAYDPK